MAEFHMESKLEHLRNVSFSEQESLEAQLDRLNVTIADLLKPKLESSLDSINLQLHDDMETDEICNENLLIFFQDYDRALMIVEDFRGNEQRKQQKSKENLKIQCTLSELLLMNRKLVKDIERIESGLMKCIEISLGVVKIKLEVSNDSSINRKCDILHSFSEKGLGVTKNSSYIKQLENELEEYKYLAFRNFEVNCLDQCMKDAYCEELPIKYEFLPSGEEIYKGQVSVEIQYHTMKKLNEAKKCLLTDLSWEVNHAKTISCAYSTKIQDLKAWEIKLESRMAAISDHELIIKAERKKLRDHNEKINKKSRALHSAIESVKKQAKIIQKAVTVTESIENTSNFICETQRWPESESDVKGLEKELEELENKLETSIDRSSVLFEINRLKNKISVSKSQRILANNLKTGKSFMDRSSNEKKIDSGKLSLNLDTLSSDTLESPKFAGKKVRIDCKSRYVSPLPSSSRSSQPVFIESTAKDENLTKLLDFKQERLKKREEELNKKEANLHSTWMKVPNANDLIPILQQEIIRYKNKDKELTEKYKEVDRIIKESIRAQKSASDAEIRRKELISQLQEKIKIFGRIDELFSVFQMIDF